MRKYLVAAVAALTVVGGTTAALAQTATGPTLTVTVKPTKAGTKKKPKNSSIRLVVVNNDPKKSLSKIAITLPRTLKVSGKGFKTCSAGKILDDPASCPRGAKVGGGSSDILVGVNGTSPSPLTLTVTAFVGSKTLINFYIHGGAINVVAPGKLRGRKLTVTIPQSAQTPAPNVWTGLKKLDATLKGKAKTHLLIASTGCKGGKDPFTAALTFADNGVSTPGTVSVSHSARCKK